MELCIPRLHGEFAASASHELSDIRFHLEEYQTGDPDVSAIHQQMLKALRAPSAAAQTTPVAALAIDS